MINLDIVEPSESPYCSPALIVKKKDNTNRFCIDIRTFNEVTVFDAEPMPNMEDIFTKLAGHKYIYQSLTLPRVIGRYLYSRMLSNTQLLKHPH